MPQFYFQNMKTKNRITGYCIAARNRLALNGDIILATEESLDVPAFCKAAYEHLEIKYQKFFKMDNLSKLAIVTSEMLFRNHNPAGRYSPDEIGVILSNSSSSLDTDNRYHESISSFPSPSLFVYTLPSILAGEICIKNKITGENAFFIFEKFDADFMCGYVNDLLDRDVIRACLTGWVDVKISSELKSGLGSPLLWRGGGGEAEAMFFLVEKKPALNQNLIFDSASVQNLIKQQSELIWKL